MRRSILKGDTVNKGKAKGKPKRVTLDLVSEVPAEKLNLKNEFRIFKDPDLMMKDEDKRRAYQSKFGKDVSQIKWGQRKLIMSIIQFFTIYWDPKRYPEPTCVYVGAAPGVSINVMSILFPSIKWILYDKNDMNRGLPKENVTFIQDYFEDKDVEQYKGKDGIFFISDIRGGGYTKEFGAEQSDRNETIVMNDMLLQQNWVLEINPVFAQLKFRLAYTYFEDDEGKYPYLQGIPYRQCYNGLTSAEGRLVPTRNEKGEYYLTEWSSKEYEDKFFYFNTVERNGNLTTYKNPFTDVDDNIDPGETPELINDWDSNCEVDTIIKYLNKMNVEPSYENVKKISEFITNEINRVRKRKSEHSIHKKRVEKEQTIGK